MKRVLLILIILLAATTGPKAQQMKLVDAGDPQGGLAYAKEVCANCHSITNDKSPEPAATTFREIANVSGMSAEALLLWMETLHPNMPNITLECDDLMDVIAYVLSLRTAAEQRKLMAEEVVLGDSQAGLAYAKEACSACHGVAGEESPVPEATAFSKVANVQEMSAKSLLVWMRVIHPTMPNIIPEREDLMNVIAYILSQKDKSQSDNQ